MFAEIKSIQNETEQYMTAVGNATKSNELLNQLVSKKREVSAGDIDRLEAFVPTKINEVTVLADLNSLAKAHGMLFGNIDISTRKSDMKTGLAPDSSNPNATDAISYDSFTSSDITFSVIGSYIQFKSLLRALEKNLVLMEIKNISLSANEGPLQQYTITVRVYSLPATK
jgi:hypothetical protein